MYNEVEKIKYNKFVQNGKWGTIFVPRVNKLIFLDKYMFKF